MKLFFFSAIIEFKNGRVFVNFLRSIRIIPFGGCTDNRLCLARKCACILDGY